MRTICGVMRYFAVFCCTAFAALNMQLAVSAEDPDFNVKVSAPPHVVFMGDSIASGYGLEGYSKEDRSLCASYANILTKVFESELPESANFTSDNFAKDGLTSKGLLKKLKNGEMDKSLADADAVCVSIGGNDLLGPLMNIVGDGVSLSDSIDRLLSLETELDENLDKFEDNLPEIVEEISTRAKNENYKIFIQTLYDPLEDSSLPMLEELSAKEIKRLNDIIYDASENGTKYKVIDVADSFVGRAEELTNIMDFDIHPNADGHALIAKNIRAAVEKETYTYYDNEAAMQYEIEQQRLRQLEAEQAVKRRKIIVCCSAAAAVICILLPIASSLRKRRKNKITTLK